MNEKRAGRIVGEVLADLVFFSCILGIGVFSTALLSKLIKFAVTREIMRNVNKNNQANHNDRNEYPDSDLE